jgi:hypothetical protein
MRSTLTALIVGPAVPSDLQAALCACAGQESIRLVERPDDQHLTEEWAAALADAEIAADVARLYPFAGDGAEAGGGDPALSGNHGLRR